MASTSPNSERIEQIVAYLDGELSPEESARVEARLASDETFRQELQGVERAWNALDELPIETVNDDFARTTLDLVVDAVHAEVQAKTLALPTQKKRRGLAALLSGAAAALLGLLTVRVLTDNPNRHLLADLPVIQNVGTYTQLDDVEFLARLREALGSTKFPVGVEQAEIDDQVAQFHTIGAPSERLAWVKRLPDDQQVALRAKFNLFRSLPADEQARLRGLQGQVAASPEDQDTFVRYQLWLNGLPASEQYELRGMPIDKRVEEVAKLVSRQGENRGIELSSRKLAEVLELINKHFDQLVATGFRDISDDERREFESEDQRDKMRELQRRFRSRSQLLLPELMADVQRALPPVERAHFEQLSAEGKRDQFSRWWWQAIRERRDGGRRRGEIPEQELETLFVELNARDQERLLSMPRDRMEQQLLRIYRESQSRENYDDSNPPDQSPRERRGRSPDRRGEFDRPGPDRPDHDRRDGPPRPNFRPGDEAGRPPGRFGPPEAGQFAPPPPAGER